MNENIKNFVDEYKKLVDKFQVDFANYPIFIPDGAGGFRVIINSTPIDLEEAKKAQEKKDESSFVAKD